MASLTRLSGVRVPRRRGHPWTVVSHRIGGKTCPSVHTFVMDPDVGRTRATATIFRAGFLLLSRLGDDVGKGCLGSGEGHRLALFQSIVPSWLGCSVFTSPTASYCIPHLAFRFPSQLSLRVVPSSLGPPPCSPHNQEYAVQLSILRTQTSGGQG